MQAIDDYDEEQFDQLWDTPELRQIDKRFRRDPYVAVPKLLQAGRTVWEVAKAYKSCALVVDFGEGYIVPDPGVIHAAAKSGAEWELADRFPTRADAAQRIADELAEEIRHGLILGVDDVVEVETYLFGYDSTGGPVRVSPQTHFIALQDAGDFGRF